MREEVERLCAEAREEQYRAVVVPSSRVALAYDLLEGSQVKVSCLIGFPLGWSDPDAKRYEIDAAVDSGAHEIEYVPSLALLKERQYSQVLREIRDASDACDERPLKVLVEASVWLDEELAEISRLALDSGAKFLSAGLVPSLQLVEKLRGQLGAEFGLKVEIGALEQAEAALQAGADIFSVARLARPGSKRPAVGI
jgi:deoxyribose-phosphate aldolase